MSERSIARRISATTALLVLMIAWATSSAKGEMQAAAQSQEPNRYLVEMRKKIAGRESEPAEKVFKNIQLLKGIPAGRMLNIMDVAFNRGLGVDCTHCHVEGEWEKEDKETKQIARNMWNFMRKVNDELKQAVKERPNAFVNCATCHRGQPNPNAPPKK
ncbi:MAG: photosynthetic reaction center cytochrome c subunit [Blastocatellia bacterium]|nr:photosynthetic reaction center cytochrome c subunit [Blastocatellia bacterium]